MRPDLVAWLEAHGLPGWLAPDYLMLGGIGAVVGGMIALRLAPREHRRTYAWALFSAYLSTYLVGHVFEGIRAIPRAIAAGDPWMIVNAGRAAWGGLFGSILGAWLVLRKSKAPLLPFFDAVAVSVGVVFCFVRVGCFLGGCDFGLPTSSALGVRFPPGSFAAVAHAEHGWISSGQPSLPVHATQLYESAFGALSALFICALTRAGLAQGYRFLVWIGLYSVFRFGNELWRGDGDRGVYSGLSTAQIVSISMIISLAGIRGAARARRRR